MRIVRFICLLALLLAGASLYRADSAAAQGSPEAQQACTPDAMRLCSAFIPDVPKVTACMKRKYGQLSPACRTAMRGGRHEARHTQRYGEQHEARHHRGRGHCDKFTHLCS